jgi:hypothetical protein
MSVPKKKTEVEEILERSGHGFHSRVANLLRDLEWSIVISPYYNDGFTDKPREIDLVAQRAFDIYDFTQSIGTVNPRLFIECKYISQPIVVWFDEKDKGTATKRIMQDTGLADPRQNVSVLQHHYLSTSQVAKLFSSKKGEENEVMTKAINQSLNAMVYYRHRHDLIPSDTTRYGRVLKYINYPLIVVNSFDNFYRVGMNDPEEKPEKITAPFQLEVNYAYLDKDKNSQNEYFLIDVVSIEQLPDFLSSLEKSDISILRAHLAWQKTMQRNNTPDGRNSAR